MLYQLSYGPLNILPGSPAEIHGQGQNRTADTMIFSHVLYQLSYLADKKTARASFFRDAGGELVGEDR